MCNVYLSMQECKLEILQKYICTHVEKMFKCQTFQLDKTNKYTIYKILIKLK